MKTKKELIESIEEYNTQMSLVNEALLRCTSSDKEETLINLKDNLIEIIKLTEQALKQTKCVSDESNREGTAPADIQIKSPSTQNDNDPYADEMALFLSEINEFSSSDKNQISTANITEKNNNNIEIIEEIQTLTDKLTKELYGKKYLAPHIHTWGGKTYHNAFICGFEENTDYSATNEVTVKVKVLFINPTHREMIPCEYYLNGDCRFDTDKCHFSHGELVDFDDLKKYVEPNFHLLEKSNHPVLVKQIDKIWKKGKTISSDFNNKMCKVKLEENRKEVNCNFEDILPIQIDEANLNSSDDDDDDDNNHSSNANDYDNAEQSIRYLEPITDKQGLGEWEKYTKGFGSKIMQKYGYIMGDGLGTNGAGIVEPIDAEILPPGRSLDHCMKLRERSNGELNLFSVEKKLKHQQKKQEQINEKNYEKELKKQQNEDMFSFINKTIFNSDNNNSEASSSSKSEMLQKKLKTDDNLKKYSNKSLRTVSLEIDENIRKKSKEIIKIKESMKRHKIGTSFYDKLKIQLDVKNIELNKLKQSNVNISNEQFYRKDQNKLSIF